MHVFIDSREQEMISKLTTYFESNKDKFPYIESLSVKTLPSGDLCTDDNYFGCERKSPSDFISSLVSGKLRQQLIELKHTYQNPLFIVEGYDGMQDCILKNAGNINPNVIIGATTSALSHYSVPIQYVGGLYEKFTLSLINKFYDGKQQRYQSEYTPVRRAATSSEYKMNIIKALPGVGSTIATNLLQHYNNSISSIVNASIEDLTTIEGIGKERAKQIKEVLS